MKQLRETYKGAYDFDILSGGLVIGIRVCKISEKATYLKRRMPDVERITGVKFGEPFYELLNKGEYISNSEPPSIAFNVFKSFRPDIAFELGHAIQEAHYLEGKDLNNIKTYFDISDKYEINKFGFMERYSDPAFKKITLDDFAKTSSWGADNYPMVFLNKQDEVEPISEGYVDFKTLKNDFDEIIQESKA